VQRSFAGRASGARPKRKAERELNDDLAHDVRRKLREQGARDIAREAILAIVTGL
jgi:hypothetical protein